jgi:hypothetical protein
MDRMTPPKEPVYQALNMRLKVGPADRSMFVFAIIAALAVAVAYETTLGSFAMFAVFYALACVMGSKDPEWGRFWVIASRQKNYYDAWK